MLQVLDEVETCRECRECRECRIDEKRAKITDDEAPAQLNGQKKYYKY